MILTTDKVTFSRMVKLATDMGTHYKKLAVQALDLGVQILWHKYYSDCRIVVLHNENGKERIFHEFKIDLKGHFDGPGDQEELG
jgi:hypothetical protein